MNTAKDPQRNDLLRQARIERNWRQHELAELLGTSTVTVKRWERGAQQPSSYFLVKLCTLFSKSAEELGLISVEPSSHTQEDLTEPETEPARSPSPELPGLWTVPYLRNPHFTGREDLLEQLDQRLSPAGKMCRAALTQPQAIKGLGGIGKTQIAVEYAYRTREQGHYTHLFWINAANEEAIIASFLTLAQHLPSGVAKDEQDQSKLIAAVVRWLEQCSQPWLLIVDNADDLTLVQFCLPQQGQGSILLTTRATAVSWLGNPLEVEPMGLMEGTQFLLHRTGRLLVSDEESNEACNIVIALDGFPLALDQAGAYIEETGCSFAEYLQLYEQHRATLLARRGKQANNYPQSVATTWDLSFQKIERTYPAAAELLRLCAFLFPDHIPEELLTRGAKYWPPLLQEAVTDLLYFNELLSALLAFSLVKRLAQEQLLSLHRLVQAVQQDRIDEEEQRQWAERVIRAVNDLFPAHPKEDIHTWPLCQRYLEQVQACDLLIQKYQLPLHEAANLLERAGIYLREHASYSAAEQLFLRALTIVEQKLELEPLRVASLLTNLGMLYCGQGRADQAAPLLERALHITEEAAGPNHVQNAVPLSQLGRLYLEQGLYEQAEPLLERALRITEQATESNSPRLALALSNLGVLYRQQGKFEQAESLFEQVLHIRKQVLGPNHPEVASCISNLGILYARQGKFEQAEPLFEQALHIWELTLTSHHPRLATALNNLAETYRRQGKFECAEPLFEQALHIWELTLGPDYLETAMVLDGLGTLYRQQNRYDQARPLLERALRILEQSQGPHHPMVAQALSALAILAQEQSQYEQAEELYRRALTLRQKQLGFEHIDTAETLHDLALLKQMQQQLTEALSLYQQALPIREQVLGSHHPKTCETRERLRAVLVALGKTQEAAAIEVAQLNHAK